MTTIGRGWVTAFGLTLMTAACGSSQAPDAAATSSTAESPPPIKRTPTPVNEFTPVELEATVDNLIAELNNHANKPMHAEILLKVITGFFAPVTTAANRAMGRARDHGERGRES